MRTNVHQEIQLEINSAEPVSKLIEQVSEKLELNKYTARFVASGKELQADKAIGTYITEDGVVTVFLKPLQPK